MISMFFSLLRCSNAGSILGAITMTLAPAEQSDWAFLAATVPAPMTTVRLSLSSRYMGYFDMYAILPIRGAKGQEYNIDFEILLFGFEKKAGRVFFCGSAESRVDMGRRQLIMLELWEILWQK